MVGGGIDDDENDRPIGEYVGRLFDDGKAYAQAEFELVRVKAEAKAESYRTATILGAAAFLFGLAAVVTLFVTIGSSLATLIGPLAGGLIATLLAAGIAAGLGSLAKQRIEAKND
jgi:hypothetical protein